MNAHEYLERIRPFGFSGACLVAVAVDVDRDALILTANGRRVRAGRL